MFITSLFSIEDTILSAVNAETICRAQAVHPIANLQIEYSLISCSIETDILPTADMAQIEQAIPVDAVAGRRYDAGQMEDALHAIFNALADAEAEGMGSACFSFVGMLVKS